MYCSSCAARLTEGLSYCNCCGAEVGGQNRTVPLKPAPIPEALVWGLVAVSVGGIGTLIGLFHFHFSFLIITTHSNKSHSATEQEATWPSQYH